MLGILFAWPGVVKAQELDEFTFGYNHLPWFPSDETTQELIERMEALEAELGVPVQWWTTPYILADIMYPQSRLAWEESGQSLLRFLIFGRPYYKDFDWNKDLELLVPGRLRGRLPQAVTDQVMQTVVIPLCQGQPVSLIMEGQRVDCQEPSRPDSLQQRAALRWGVESLLYYLQQGRLPTLVGAGPEMYTAYFVPHPDQRGALDDGSQGPTGDFPPTTIKDTVDDYLAAFKALAATGDPDLVRFQWEPAPKYPIEGLYAATATGQTVPISDSSTLTLTALPPGSHEVGLYAPIEGSEEDLQLGMLRVQSYAQETRYVHLIPVGDEVQIKWDASKTAAVQAALNATYGQANVRWEVSEEPRFTEEEWDHYYDGLHFGDNAFLRAYPKEATDLIRDWKRAYRAAGNRIRKNHYYLFLVHGGDYGKWGYMPRKRQYGFIFNNLLNEELPKITKTIAHELGHGAFRFQHWWEVTDNAEQSTDNLMDYRPEGTELRYHQWEVIRNPPWVATLLDDQNDAAQGNPCFWINDYINYYWPGELTNQVQARESLFNHVHKHYDRLYESGQSDNLDLAALHEGDWSLRKASFGKSQEKGVFDKIISKLIKEGETASFNLRKNGIYMGKYTIEGIEYPVTMYAEKARISLGKVVVTGLCDLAKEENLMVFVEDYILICFFDEGELVFTIQIEKDDYETVEVWLKYLLMWQEEETWADEVRAWWASLIWDEEEEETEEEEITCASGFCCQVCGRDLTIDKTRLQAIFPSSTMAAGADGNEYASLFNTALQTTEFNTCERQAKLFAQIGHESWNFNAKVEGENSKGIAKIWKLSKILSYFKRTGGAKRHWFNQEFWEDGHYKDIISSTYYEEVDTLGLYSPTDTTGYSAIWNGAAQPGFHVDIPSSFIEDTVGTFGLLTFTEAEQDANRIRMFSEAYDKTLGNSDLAAYPNSQDGWNYRGRGAIQLTGKLNYEKNQQKILEWFNLSFDLVNNPDLLKENKTVLVYSSVAFILQNVNSIEDLDEMTIDQVSALVNTGNSNSSISNVNGAEDRRSRYENLINNEVLFKCDEE